MERPLVSVVIPAYNMARFLPESIRSVFSQGHRPLEIVVVNDASTDETSDVVKENFSEAPSDCLCSLIDLKKNGGAANALRTGFSAASGEFVCWLSADDAFLDIRKTTHQLDAMSKTGAAWSFYQDYYAGAALGSASLFKPNYLPRMRLLNPVFTGNPELMLMMLLFRNPINGSSVMIRRSSTQFGEFDPFVRNVDPDGDLWMRYCALGLRAVALSGAPLFYRIHSQQTSNDRGRMLKGIELVRLRLLKTLSSLDLLGPLVDRFAPSFVLLALEHKVEYPYTAEFLCRYVLETRESRSRLIAIAAARSLSRFERDLRSTGLERSDLESSVNAGLHSQEFSRFKSLLSRTQGR
jgi:glycosyltransferase involved in cell wall biosynthesis